jgi:hypothetical protein
MRLLVAAVLCFGCIATNRVTLDETAALFHDDLRWGRIPAAETSVDARAREAFQQHHRGWGAQVRVVDLDVATPGTTPSATPGATPMPPRAPVAAPEGAGQKRRARR